MNNLLKIITNYDLIGIGEETHGEIISWKFRYKIIKYLTKNYDKVYIFSEQLDFYIKELNNKNIKFIFNDSGFYPYIIYNANMTKEHLDRIKNHIEKHGGDYKIEKIKSLSLNSILEENLVTNIDYLSIDTEGSELNILKGIDYNKYSIDIISAENNNDSDMSVRLFLESKGYSFITKCCADEIYKKNK